MKKNTPAPKRLQIRSFTLAALTVCGFLTLALMPTTGAHSMAVTMAQGGECQTECGCDLASDCGEGCGCETECDACVDPCDGSCGGACRGGCGLRDRVGSRASGRAGCQVDQRMGQRMGQRRGQRLGNRRCPKCECDTCGLEVKEIEVTKLCFKTEQKLVCIPKVRMPWQKCCPPGVSKTRSVNVLQPFVYKCPACAYIWSPNEPAETYQPAPDCQSCQQEVYAQPGYEYPEHGQSYPDHSQGYPDHGHETPGVQPPVVEAPVLPYETSVQPPVAEQN